MAMPLAKRDPKQPSCREGGAVPAAAAHNSERAREVVVLDAPNIRALGFRAETADTSLMYVIGLKARELVDPQCAVVCAKSGVDATPHVQVLSTAILSPLRAKV